MEKLNQEILHKAEEINDWLVSITQQLVQTPSINHPPSGDELQCQMLIVDYLRNMGLDPDIYSLDRVSGLKEHPSFWSKRDYQNRPNVSARIPGRGDGRSLVLSGHIDTVPLGAKEWAHDPFGGQVENGRLYGLGAYDMKGGVAINLGVMRILQELGVELKGDLVFESVVDEEFAGVNGTLAARLHNGPADGVIIPEPTDLMICNSNKGGQQVHITLEGPEGIIFHDQEPGHAIRQLKHFLKWVDIFRKRRHARLPDWQPGKPDPIPVMITKVDAGGWGWGIPVTVPSEVKIELYWQFMPGEKKEQVLQEFFDVMDEMVSENPNDFIKRPKIEFPTRFMPGSEIPADARLITELNRNAREIVGHHLDVGPLLAPSDLYVVQLDFNTPAVHLGPRGEGAHSADEYVVVEDLLLLTKVIASFVLDWCEVV